MKIPTSIKVLLTIIIILWSCFEILQFFNRQYALQGGKSFLKAHNATVDYLDCYIPAARTIDQADKICTFKATSDQIKTLVKNLRFRSIDLGIGEDEIDRISDEWDKQIKTKGKVEPLSKEQLYDWRRLKQIDQNSCWGALNLKNRAEFELYGKSENQDKFRSDFFVFYKRLSMTGCVHFPFIGG